jgi:nucleoside-diphosphate-sugar epimerase
MNRILVTGANGYIGKSIVSWFSKSEDTLVIPLTRKDVDLPSIVALYREKFIW